MRIQIGLLGKNPMWGELLTQEGVPFSIISDDSSISSDQYSALIIGRPIAKHETSGIAGFLRGGGALLGRTDYCAGLQGVQWRSEEIRFVTGDKTFPVDLCDIDRGGAVSSNANHLLGDRRSPTAFFGQLEGGVALLLPFDLAEVTMNDQPSVRRFYAVRERLPSERVSRAGKGAIRQLLHHGLQQLHHIRNMPYVHLWYYPGEARSLFAFRIDTDGAQKSEIDDLYALGRECGVPMSWYLDAKSHEPWLDRFVEMEGQEIGLHCYRHQTFSSCKENKDNIDRAKNAMEQCGLKPTGFTAPFGIWNSGLAQAIDDSDFEYSSEFSYAYDSLPLWPTTLRHRFHTVQVPIHPVCIGSMKKVGYSAADQKKYFHRQVRLKKARAEPLFFYHHPSDKNLDVVQGLFEMVKADVVPLTTLGAYARWWRRRSAIQYELNWSGKKMDCLAQESADQDIALRISIAERGESFSPLMKVVDFDSLAWSLRQDPGLPPEDIQRTREFDLRTTISSMYNRFQRALR